MVDRKHERSLEGNLDTSAAKKPNLIKNTFEDDILDAKVFNDPIHGHIELHPLLIKIIDTPQFQRLRYIKQLGGGYYVFPGASHNRFEHSIGVSYLAGEFVESISRRQPELNITKCDILCIKIAGLCHDLGHGPFSHMFDGMFIPQILGKGQWKHEDGSKYMLDHLIECNNLQLEQHGLGENDIEFIKELILPKKEVTSATDWPYKGRAIEKSFLYEIVANKRTGIDVDKWDYFARDCHCLGIPNNFDRKRYMLFARVIEVNGVRQICCRDKEVTNLYEMFHTRASLHRRAYLHKTKNIVEIMITEALVEANDHLSIPGENNKKVKMSDAIHDPYAFTNLNDSIIFEIMQSAKPELAKSKLILDRLQKRQLYSYIGQTQPLTDFEEDEEKLKDQIVNSYVPEHDDGVLAVDDLIVKCVTFDYGMKDKNPIDQMRFYTKQNPDEAVEIHEYQVSQMLPQKFTEKTIRVYCRSLDKARLKTARRCFIKWCESQQNPITPNKKLDDSNSQMTTYLPYGTPFSTPIKDESAELRKEGKSKKNLFTK